jgi:hypothetical protein
VSLCAKPKDDEGELTSWGQDGMQEGFEETCDRKEAGAPFIGVGRKLRHQTELTKDDGGAHANATEGIGSLS